MKSEKSTHRLCSWSENESTAAESYATVLLNGKLKNLADWGTNKAVGKKIRGAPIGTTR